MGVLALVSLVLPLLGGFVLGLVPSSRTMAGGIGAGTVAAAFVAAVAVAFMGGIAFPWGSGGALTAGRDWVFGQWATVGPLHIPLGLWIDGLSTVFALVITGVGLLIVVYSLSYMAGEQERDYRRYFAGMDLFIGAMLLLVLADNFVLMLIGWAGVGFASYLLIGFWYDRPVAVVAARKAFILNTVGDVALILAIADIALRTGSVRFAQVLGAGSPLSSGAVWIGVLLFIAAAAKSAQFPLQSWLSDAMEGPTPVSALIHAATMVTAGVYLIARCALIYQSSPVAAEIAGNLAAFTALGAAIAAVAAYDLKRGLAYSTMSQVGYMISGVAFGALAAGVSHVITHAFFKALLFMSAGIVMHATGDERDIRRYGGLGKHLPLARMAFLVGALALAGIPPFAGFWSKDAVMGALLSSGHIVAYLLLAAAALITPFYAFRLYYLTFGGQRRSSVPLHTAVPLSMRWPTATLAVLAIVGGGFAVALQRSWGSGLDLQSMAISVVLALIGWGLAYRLYHAGDLAADRWLPEPIGAILRSEYGWEALWQRAIVDPAHALGAWVVAGWDGSAWPSAEGALAALASLGSQGVRVWQSGLVRRYALTMLWGAALLLLWAMIRR